MSKFLQTINDCPENVQAFVRQTILTNEWARILDEIERFKRLAFAQGQMGVVATAEAARAAFVTALDSLDGDKSEAA